MAASPIIPTRTQQLAHAHHLAHEIGLDTRQDRRAYENVLFSLIGLRSLKHANRSQRAAVIAFLEDEYLNQASKAEWQPVPFVSSDEARALL